MIERNKDGYYYAECDGGCGYIIDWDLEHDVFKSKSDLIRVLKTNKWQRKGKKWYCPDCRGKK